MPRPGVYFLIGGLVLAGHTRLRRACDGGVHPGGADGARQAKAWRPCKHGFFRCDTPEKRHDADDPLAAATGL